MFLYLAWQRYSFIYISLQIFHSYYHILNIIWHIYFMNIVLEIRCCGTNQKGLRLQKYHSTIKIRIRGFPILTKHFDIYTILIMEKGSVE